MFFANSEHVVMLYNFIMEEFHASDSQSWVE